MKLYVLIRSDLSKSQQAVQGGHAVAEFMRCSYMEDNDWDNGTLVYLRGGNSEEELTFEYYRFINRKAKFLYPFYEPDLDDEMTAFAVLGTPETLETLEKYRLV